MWCVPSPWMSDPGTHPTAGIAGHFAEITATMFVDGPKGRSDSEQLKFVSADRSGAIFIWTYANPASSAADLPPALAVDVPDDTDGESAADSPQPAEPTTPGENPVPTAAEPSADESTACDDFMRILALNPRITAQTPWHSVQAWIADVPELAAVPPEVAAALFSVFVEELQSLEAQDGAPAT